MALQDLVDKENEIHTGGRVGVNGGTVTISEESGVPPPVPLATWLVVNEPFHSMLKASSRTRESP